jgi:predicted nucleotidyltransferase
MIMNEIGFPPKQRAYMERLIDICNQDQRITAVVLVGSYATRRADEYSDIDLVLFIRDEDLADFGAQIRSFICLNGEPVFMENWDTSNLESIIYQDHIDVEMHYVAESRAGSYLDGPYCVLLDKKDLPYKVVPPGSKLGTEDQKEALRHLLYWFWHDMTHFITAMRREQYWWAQGELEILRGYCINLARLDYDFLIPEGGNEPYFKVEHAVDEEKISALKATFGPLEKDTLIKSVMIVYDCYRKLAVPLAERNGIEYPRSLEETISGELIRLSRSDTM